MSKKLVVIVAGGLLAVLVVSGFPSIGSCRGTRLNGVKNAINSSMMAQLKTGLRNYKEDYGQNLTGDNRRVYRAFLGDNPRGIIYMEFKKDDAPLDDQIVDAWGTPYEMLGDDKGITVIRSAGKDKKLGTPDDVVLTIP